MRRRSAATEVSATSPIPAPSAHPARALPAGGGRCAAHQDRPGGFTLVELLVVIVIIGVLTAIALSLASRVTQGGRESLSRNIIRTLDGVVESYVGQTGDNPAAYWTDRRQRTFPLVDGRPVSEVSNGTGPQQPTTAIFLAMAQEAGVDSSIQDLDPKYVAKRGPIEVWGYQAASNSLTRFNVTGNEDQTFSSIVVSDAFGNPIRMVHPSFDGGAGEWYTVDGMPMPRDPIVVERPTAAGGASPSEWSRSFRPFNPTSAPAGAIGDADEGICSGKRPYFYSAGSDGDPGQRGDNIYSTQPPRFPEETAPGT